LNNAIQLFYKERVETAKKHAYFSPPVTLNKNKDAMLIVDQDSKITPLHESPTNTLKSTTSSSDNEPANKFRSAKALSDPTSNPEII
jgi:hypothetical protein